MTATDTDRYTTIVTRIERLVAALNAEFGLDQDGRTFTFGYIGNLTLDHDDRSWMVFLPHPGRVGTPDDQIGSFRTGDMYGALAALNALIGFRRGLQYAARTPAVVGGVRV